MMKLMTLLIMGDFSSSSFVQYYQTFLCRDTNQCSTKSSYILPSYFSTHSISVSNFNLYSAALNREKSVSIKVWLLHQHQQYYICISNKRQIWQRITALIIAAWCKPYITSTSLLLSHLFAMQQLNTS